MGGPALALSLGVLLPGEAWPAGSTVKSYFYLLPKGQGWPAMIPENQLCLWEMLKASDLGGPPKLLPSGLEHLACGINSMKGHFEEP